MSQSIYKVYFAKYKEPWYKLTSEERNKLWELDAAALKQVGAERIVDCESVWANEQWLGWGVEKFPDIEAFHKYAVILVNLNWFEYFDSITYLGTDYHRSSTKSNLHATIL